MILRCAVYARFSSEKQSPLSIEDQIRKCREYAQTHGWSVIDQHVYVDEAVSGATDDRCGLRQMLAAATSAAKPFDVVLVDDTSRISRTLKDSFTIHDELRFAGVRLVFVSQGIDTDSEQAEVLLATHGIVDSLYLKELGRKVHRGVEGKALSGLHTGGRCFGYRNVPIEDPTRVDQHGRTVITGVRLEVRDDQAAIVRRIFTMYAGGNSLQKIAKQLNAEGVISPQPQKGRISRSWCPSSIRTILRNDRYRGRVVWGKTLKVRSRTGKRIYKRTTSDKWVVRDIPEQRVISEDLWNSVQALCQFSVPVFRATECAVCGANISIVSGKWRGRGDVVYGCPQNTYRGETVCSNGVRIFRQELERKLLDGLQEQVMRSEVIDYVLAKFEADLASAVDNLSGELGQMRRRKQELEREIGNLANFVAQGDCSPGLRAGLVDREREIGEITERLLEARPDSLETKLRNIRALVESRMKDIRGMLNSDPARVRVEFAKHIEKITMEPSGEHYVASGTWHLVGRGSIDGARARIVCNSHRIPFHIDLAA
jgi:DNA invertase Pin-like site-specific DNA recombinase